jgi:arylsulfatase A-like enzyme
VQVWYSPDRRQSAVLQGRWKGVWMLDTLRLFDLARDPGEQVDLASSEPQVVARLDAIRRAEDQRRVHPARPGP